MILISCLNLYSIFQDVPAHATTPTKSSSNVETPQPLSSSAPSYYDNDVVVTPRAPALMDTPVEMVLSARRVHHDSGKHTKLWAIVFIF